MQLDFKLPHFSVRQLAGPDRSGNFPHRIDLKHKTIGDGGPPSCDRGQRQRWLVLISSSCWKLWRPPCDRGRFGLGQGCIFRAPIMSWPRIMCSYRAHVKILRTVTKNAVNKSVWSKKYCSWLPLNKHAMNIWLSSLRIRAHLRKAVKTT